jgi:hypothetical protein
VTANPPSEILIELQQLQSATTDLLRAIMVSDQNYIIGDLRKIAWHRDRLVNQLQTWRPELRISA